MEENKLLQGIILSYLQKLDLIKTLESAFVGRSEMLRRKRRQKILILQKLRNQQLLLLMALKDESIGRRTWQLNRQSTFWEDCCQNSSDEFFKHHFRIGRANFAILCAHLKRLQKKDTNFRKAISVPKRVAIALYLLGSLEESRRVSQLFGVGAATACGILIKFCEEVWASMSGVYLNSFPLTQETITECVNGFTRLGLPQCLGAIDTCHIEVLPKPDQTEYYCNAKGWHSVVLLSLIDYRGKFLYIDADAPGRCKTAEIYEKSKLKEILDDSELLQRNTKKISNVPVPVYIFGDSGFRLDKNLIKPYRQCKNLSKDKQLVNQKLKECSQIAKKTLEHLRARFRRLSKGLENRFLNASTIIKACCVLHNFLTEKNDQINMEWLIELRELEKQTCTKQWTNACIDDSNPEAELIRNALRLHLSVEGASMDEGSCEVVDDTYSTNSEQDIDSNECDSDDNESDFEDNEIEPLS